MDIKRLNPWNWFSKEDQGSALPVRRGEPVTYGISPFEQLHRQMDRLFDEFTRGFGSFGFGRDFDHAVLNPAIDIAETDKEYRISVELPGVSEKDVSVELIGDSLRISGEKRREHEEKDGYYHRVESSYGSFSRVLNLPNDVKADGIEAKFKNGVMTITIPRQAVAQPVGRRIEIKAA